MSENDMESKGNCGRTVHECLEDGSFSDLDDSCRVCWVHEMITEDRE